MPVTVTVFIILVNSSPLCLGMRARTDSREKINCKVAKRPVRVPTLVIL